MMVKKGKIINWNIRNVPINTPLITGVVNILNSEKKDPLNYFG